MKGKPTKKGYPLSKGVCFWSCVNILIFCGSIFFFYYGKIKLDESISLDSLLSNSHQNAVPLSEHVPQVEDSNNGDKTEEEVNAFNGSRKPTIIGLDLNIGSMKNERVSSEVCVDPIWCNVKMPSKSYFKFDPPDDTVRWRHAQVLAASGEAVLLKKVMKHFPHPLDFIDGDRSFRRIHALVDIFVDKTIGLDDLKQSGQNPARVDLGELGKFEGKRVVPAAYNYRTVGRAPLLSIGYTVFNRDSNEYFSGDRLGYSGIERPDFLSRWSRMKNQLDYPFIAMCQGNENWGWISTMFPNRTAKWGQCCTKPQDRLLFDFLNHEKTLMLIINQHSNVSHPKILTIPRGLPLTWENTERLVWDSMRLAIKTTKKDVLLFAASSSWGPRELQIISSCFVLFVIIKNRMVIDSDRTLSDICVVDNRLYHFLCHPGPQILACISEKFRLEEFWGHSKAPPPVEKEAMQLDRGFYYRKLSSARFGLALPGLGYDCFRWVPFTVFALLFYPHIRACVISIRIC